MASPQSNLCDNNKLNVAIAGGGIAGLVTAIALLRHPGINVQIYERAKEFKEIGASIGLGPNGLRTLEKLGLDDVISGDVCSRQKGDWPMVYRHWKTGEVIAHDIHHTVKDKKHFTARYHRAHLHQALQKHVPKELIHLGKKTVNVHVKEDERVVLSFEDGTTAEADLCIGADGIHSVCVHLKRCSSGFGLKYTRLYVKHLSLNTSCVGPAGLLSDRLSTPRC